MFLLRGENKEQSDGEDGVKEVTAPSMRRDFIHLIIFIDLIKVLVLLFIFSLLPVVTLRLLSGQECSVPLKLL